MIAKRNRAGAWRRPGAVGLPAVAVLATGATGLVALTGGPAAAEPVTVDVSYVCELPEVGERTVSVAVTADLPQVVAVGEVTGPMALSAEWELDAATAADLTAAGIGGFGEGSAETELTVTAPGVNLPLRAPTTVTGDGHGFTAQAEVPPLSFSEAGENSLALGAFDAEIQLLDNGGYPYGYGPAAISCVLAPGEDGLLPGWATVHTGEPPAGEETSGGIETPALPPATGPDAYGYDLEGTVHIREDGEGVPVSGYLDGTLDPATGVFEGQTRVRPTTVPLTLLGFIQISAEVRFETGPTTGTYLNGDFVTETPVEILVPSISIFGLPVGGGENCRISEPSTLPLSNTDGTFTPAGGGTVTGVYDVAPLENCGLLTPLISAIATGDDFGAELTLTPGDGIPDDLR
ncbi:hypothetical protein RM780_11450 [Streptomyces sp. DSM 44917]|uniref:DUF6801 domain-containing protein n=1 Tax=Streptomyces boetiae TaxID=3075541 RepID=A0ABU2L7M8_9ACTN|nr:DUF6801 domain-containing protein [Streptomyces sp. DSM 44917]MDT0307576.1 hypothetical protein [Streptomyces sp. DSM 44917]